MSEQQNSPDWQGQERENSDKRDGNRENEERHETGDNEKKEFDPNQKPDPNASQGQNKQSWDEGQQDRTSQYRDNSDWEQSRAENSEAAGEWSPGQINSEDQDQAAHQNTGSPNQQNNDEWSPGQAQEAGPIDQNPPNQQNNSGFSGQNNQYDQAGTSTPDAHTDEQRKKDREWLDKQNNKDNSTYTTPEKGDRESESGRNTTDE